MTANNGIMRTESQKKSSEKYVKKTVVQLTIKCQIEKFESLMNTEPGEGRLWSEAVSSDLMSRAEWKLEVYPNSERGNISIYLKLTGPMAYNRETLGADYHIYFVDGAGKTDSIVRSAKKFGKFSYIAGKDEVSQDQVKRARHADRSLVVAADIEFLAADDSDVKAVSVSVVEGQQQLVSKLSQLYSDEASSDCFIKIGGVNIPAHKSILVANSPAFRTMFTKPSSESESGVVQIDDFKEPEAMRAVLRYCYKGYLDTETIKGKRAEEIFRLADKYLIDDLKALMETRFIDKTLNAENVFTLAAIADAHSARRLKEACYKLIARECETVFERADWKELKKVDPELAADLVAEAFRAFNKNG